MGFLPPQSDVKLVRGLLNVYRTQCLIDYTVDHTVEILITLFCAQEADFENSSNILLRSRAWGWNNFSEGETQKQIVPGNHITMMKIPHVKILAQKLRAALKNKGSVLF